MAKGYSAQGADEIAFLDITATKQRRGTLSEVVSKVAEQVFVPLTVGAVFGLLRTYQPCCSLGLIR